MSRNANTSSGRSRGALRRDARRRTRVGRLLGHLLLAGGMAATPLLASCADSNGDLSVADLQRERYFQRGDHQGERVVVRATVAAVHGPAYFELSDDASSRTRLTVMTNRPSEVHEGDVVRITGTAAQVRMWYPSGRLPYAQDVHAHREGMTYVYDAVVLPPPPR